MPFVKSVQDVRHRRFAVESDHFEPPLGNDFSLGRVPVN